MPVDQAFRFEHPFHCSPTRFEATPRSSSFLRSSAHLMVICVKDRLKAAQTSGECKSTLRMHCTVVIQCDSVFSLQEKLGQCRSGGASACVFRRVLSICGRRSPCEAMVRSNDSSFLPDTQSKRADHRRVRFLSATVVSLWTFLMQNADGFDALS